MKRFRVQSTEYRVQSTAFTLVELMVTLSILTIGIVLVLRSFLNISANLDSGSNRIIAMQLLETKMHELEFKAKEEGGVVQEAKQEETVVGNRDALLDLEISYLATPEFGDQEELEQNKESINQAKLTLSWKEANINRDEILITYLNNKTIE